MKEWRSHPRMIEIGPNLKELLEVLAPAVGLTLVLYSLIVKGLRS